MPHSDFAQMTSKRAQSISTTDNPSKRSRKHSGLDILDLNEYCIAEILEYLNTNDVFQVYLADPRFIPACRLRFASESTVDQINLDLLSQIPEKLQMDFLEAYGKTCKIMKFKLVPEDTLLKISPLFENLSELTLSEIILDTDKAVLPLKLKSLAIDRCFINTNLLDTWIPMIADTLTELRITHRQLSTGQRPKASDLRALNYLCKLESLITDYVMLDYPDIIQCILLNNKQTLQVVTMVHDQLTQRIMPNGVWEALIDLPNLTHLLLDHTGWQGILNIGRKIFPKLESLQVNFDRASLAAFMKHLDCDDALTTVVFEDYDTANEAVQVAALKRFKNLKHLELMNGDWTCSYSVFNCHELTSLETLILNGGQFTNTKELLDLARNMKNLRKISLDYILLLWTNTRPEKFERDFTRVCKQRKPPLQFEVSVEEP